MDEPGAEGTPQHEQVLQLCISYLGNTSTLVRVCLASRLQQSQITAHVQQQLPSLVNPAIAAGMQRAQKRNNTSAALEPLNWLLNTAGPDAVGSPAVADVLLRADIWEGGQCSLAQLAFENGLRLSPQQLISASRDRVKWMREWIEEARRQAYATQSPSCNSSFLHINMLGDQDCNLPLPQLRFSTAELPDLLLVAVNLDRPQPAQHILSTMQHNKQLLYDSSGSAFNSTGSSSSSSSCSDDDDDIVQLVQQLITTAIIRGHWQLAPALAATPAAKQLSQQAMTQLLYLCIQLERLPAQPAEAHHAGDNDNPAGHDEGFNAIAEVLHDDKKAPCFEALCALPATQSISTSTIASLLRLAGKQQQYERGPRLCKLPAAQQLPSQQLCELLLQLLLPRNVKQRARQRHQLIRVLGTLQATQELAPGAALQLLSTLIEKDECRGKHNAQGMKDAQELGILTALGSQLTGLEVLQLLQQAAAQGSTDALRYIAELQPAREIVDAEGFTALLRTAMEGNVWHVAVQQLPVMQQLGADAVLALIQAGISRCSSSSTPRLLHNMLQHPAVGSFTAATLEQLLLGAAQQQQLEAVAGLVEAPAAAGLPMEAVAALLQCAVQESHLQVIEYAKRRYFTSAAVLPSLLSLPAAEQLTPGAVARILSAAAAAHNSEAISSICKLPAAQQITSDAAAALLQAALQHGYVIWQGLLRRLPQVGHLRLTGEQLSVFLRAAINAADSEGVCELCQFAAAADAAAAAEGAATCIIAPTDMQRLLSAALGSWGLFKIDLPVQSVAQLFELAAAKALGPDAVAALVGEGIQRLGGFNKNGAVSRLLLVMGLPAAAQLDQETAERLVHRALQPSEQICSYISQQGRNEREALLRALLQQPAVQRLAPDAVARLCTHFIEEALLEPMMLISSELTAARHCAFDQGVVRQMLQAAFKAALWPVFDWLVGMLAAPMDDEEVAMWCAVRGCTSAQ